MSELTLTLFRLGLLVLLWAFVFSIVGVLRRDLYGMRVSRRRTKAPAQPTPVPAAAAPAAPAPSAAPTPTPATEPPAGRRGLPTTLLVTAGSLAGTSLPLRPGGVLIGRNPECALVLDDDFASGRHARLSSTPHGWVVEDLGSTNGTYLDGVRLTGARPVTTGNVLRIGRTTLELRD